MSSYPPTPSVPSRAHRRQGFSLVEVIAAMTILAILVLLMGRLFADAQQSMQTGLRSAEANTNARAVLEFMARDIQAALLDDPGTSDEAPHLMLVVHEARTDGDNPRPSHYLGLNPLGGRELGFVAPINTPRSTNRRETKVVVYRTRNQVVGEYGGRARQFLDHRYELLRGEFYDGTSAGPMDRYNDPDWADNVPGSAYRAAWGQGALVIQNVRSVLFNYVTDIQGTAAGDIANPAGGGVFSDETDLAFLDIHLELFSPHDARRAADLFGAGPSSPTDAMIGFVERAVRRYRQRVFFYNAQGYYRRDR